MQFIAVHDPAKRSCTKHASAGGSEHADERFSHSGAPFAVVLRREHAVCVLRLPLAA